MQYPSNIFLQTSRPNLLSVADAKALDLPQITELFKDHLNPGQLHFMKLLGFNKVKIERAEGMYYIDQNCREILDFFGGFGSLAFGHNHPRILGARIAFQQEKRHEIAMAFLSQYATALAKNLADISPGISTWCFSAPPVRRPWKRRSRLPNGRPARSVVASSMRKTPFTARPRASCR